MGSTNAQRQAAFRARQKAGLPAVKVVRRQVVDRRSKGQRWSEAVAELISIQADYQEWLDSLPAGGSDATREALESICDFDLSELEEIKPPVGFGRD